MNKNPAILLLSAFVLVYFSPCASGLALKIDETTKEAMLVEDSSDKAAADSEKKDHVSTDELPSDQHFKKYVATVNEAVIDVQEGRYDHAAEKLKEAIGLEPNMPYAYDNLASAYYHLHNYEDAIAMSTAALNIDPEYANAYGNLGNIYYALNKYQEAKTCYQKAKELFQKKGNLEGVAKIEESLEQPSLK